MINDDKSAYHYLGYIDFRVGDEDNESSVETTPSNKLVAVERSHLLVWQVNGKRDT